MEQTGLVQCSILSNRPSRASCLNWLMICKWNLQKIVIISFLQAVSLFLTCSQLWLKGRETIMSRGWAVNYFLLFNLSFLSCDSSHQKSISSLQRTDILIVVCHSSNSAAVISTNLNLKYCQHQLESLTNGAPHHHTNWTKNVPWFKYLLLHHFSSLRVPFCQAWSWWLNPRRNY